jgi:hypothetical protein
LRTIVPDTEKAVISFCFVTKIGISQPLISGISLRFRRETRHLPRLDARSVQRGR